MLRSGPSLALSPWCYVPRFVTEPSVTRDVSYRYSLSRATFVEGTYKFGGLAAPHRYVIFAGHAIRLDSFGPHPEWGLCVCQDRSIFKVISIVE